MQILLMILLTILLITFIIHQIVEIKGSINFYKRLEKDHEEFMNKIKEK
jgi:hypothetical protein